MHLPVLITIIAQILPATRRGEGIGYYSMSSTLGTAIGPFSCDLDDAEHWLPRHFYGFKCNRTELSRRCAVYSSTQITPTHISKVSELQEAVDKNLFHVLLSPKPSYFLCDAFSLYLLFWVLSFIHFYAN